MIEDNEKFGVILILPECAFSAELQRDSIIKMMESIDTHLTEQGAPDEADVRSELMMDKALAISSMMASEEVDHEAAVTDIAYSFVYSFAKAIGFDVTAGLRGLTGSFIRNKLRLIPCLAEVDYQQEFEFLNRKMADHEASGDEEWDFDVSFPPTIH